MTYMNSEITNVRDEFVAEVTKQLRYEINALETLLWNGEHHPTYAPQAFIRQQGHALKGAVSLAVRLGGSVQASIPNEVIERASKLSKQAITYKR